MARFHDCLNEKPFNENSLFIWDSFYSIGVKCFAYLPCSSSSNSSTTTIPTTISSAVSGLDYGQFWKNLAHRQTGVCSNGSRLVLFDSIFDYADYMTTNLNVNQLNEVKSQLVTQSEQFFSPRKRNFKCNYMFSNFTNMIAQNFAKNFLKTSMNKTNENQVSNNKTVESDKVEDKKNTAEILNDLGKSSNADRLRAVKVKRSLSSSNSKPARHASLSKVEYPIIITCFILSFVVFTGLFLALLI